MSTHQVVVKRNSKVQTEQGDEARLHIPNIFWISLLHLMIIPSVYFFSWEAFGVCLLLLFITGPLGTNLGLHRLLSHKGLKVPKWLEYSLATIGAASGQGPVLIWVAEHRLHHRFADRNEDPHDSRKGFWYAHVGHLFYHKDFEDHEEQWMRYVPDLANQRYYRFLNVWWPAFAVSVAIPLYFLGGWAWVFWGGFMRALLMLHITWSVNSVSHMFGYRNFDTNDNSKNNWLVGILAAGEGWHNNHHADQQSARHGIKPWEFDLTYLYIRILKWLGLAKDLKQPKRQ